MKLNIQALSQVGLVRHNNEDMLSVGGVLVRDGEMSLPVELDDESQFYLLVSDGMGGHEQGERASEELLEHLGECFKEGLFRPESIEDDLRFRVKAFSDRLNQQACDEGQLRPMGCTLTGVVWSSGKAYVINAGDSRTYRYRDNILRQLTHDETVRAVSGNPNDSKSLLNCIGAGANGHLRVDDITDHLQSGDTLLVCSDGLTDMLLDEAIEEVLATSAQPAADLYAKACEAGGRDNVSVILAEIS